MVFLCLLRALVRIKRTVKPNRNRDKVKLRTVTWPLLCPCSQTNLTLWGISQRHFVSIAFSTSLWNCSFVLGYLKGKTGFFFFFSLACVDVDRVALNQQQWLHCVQSVACGKIKPALLTITHLKFGDLVTKVLPTIKEKKESPNVLPGNLTLHLRPSCQSSRSSPLI